MEKLNFRPLRADEIDVRVGMAKENGVSLLLYKDARCDMNVLDETVGALNWKRQHSRDNANCIVSIWDNEKKEWISKEDTGTESNTEAEKGLASDSFKRACVNWGIGRELYTAPFIWIDAKFLKMKTYNGKTRCDSRFAVTDLKSENGVITGLAIAADGNVVYTYGKTAKARAAKPKAERPQAQPRQDIPPQPQLGINGDIMLARRQNHMCEMCGKKIAANVSIEKTIRTFGALVCSKECLEKFQALNISGVAGV